MHIATWINIKTLFSEKKSIWKRPPRSPIHRVCFKSIKLVQITENLSNTLKPFPLEVGPGPLGEGLGPSSLHTAKGWSKARSIRGTKRATGWIFKLLLGCNNSGPTRGKQAPCGAQVGHAGSHTGCVPVKAKNFLTDLGSLELSYRAKGREETCGAGSAFPWVWGYSLWPQVQG